MKTGRAWGTDGFKCCAHRPDSAQNHDGPTPPQPLKASGTLVGDVDYGRYGSAEYRVPYAQLHIFMRSLGTRQRTIARDARDARHGGSSEGPGVAPTVVDTRRHAACFACERRPGGCADTNERQKKAAQHGLEGHTNAERRDDRAPN